MDVNYSYYTSAKGFRTVGGTAAQFLKADGSVDTNTYISTANTEYKNTTILGRASGSYQWHVIPLCELTNDSISADRYSTVKVYLKRNNGNGGLATELQISVAKLYNSEIPIVSFNYDNIELNSTYGKIRIVIFTYNSKKYIGIDLRVASEYDKNWIIEGFSNQWSIIKAINYYTSNPIAVINSEIYNSIVEWTPNGTLNYNPDRKFSSNIEAQGFKKVGSSDSYMMLGGGSHKPISDFMSSNHAANGVTSTKISNWDTAYSWGNYKDYGLGRTDGIVYPSLNTLLPTSISDVNGTNIGRPFEYGSVLTMRKNATESTQLAIDYFSGEIYTRGLGSSYNNGWNKVWSKSNFNPERYMGSRGQWYDANSADTINPCTVKHWNMNSNSTNFSSNYGASMQIKPNDVDWYFRMDFSTDSPWVDLWKGVNSSAMVKVGILHTIPAGATPWHSRNFSSANYVTTNTIQDINAVKRFNSLLIARAGILSDHQATEEIFLGDGSIATLTKEIIPDNSELRIMPELVKVHSAGNYVASENRLLKILVADTDNFTIERTYKGQDILIINPNPYDVNMHIDSSGEDYNILASGSAQFLSYDDDVLYQYNAWQS